LTAVDAAALEEPTALGHRILAGLSHYFEFSPALMHIQGEVDLVTRTPTIEILHAYRCVSDSDFALCHRYHATLHPVPSDAPATQAVLSMQTDRGVLVFQANGEVGLELPK
jgi:hypothetical protein